MNKISKILFPVLIIGLFASCEESKSAAFVYGKVEVSPGGKAEFQGSLAETGKADVYGYCEKKGDNFNFTVGHTSARDLDQVILTTGVPVYLSVSGIVGPPSDGVYDLSDAEDLEPDPKDDEELETVFGSAVIKTDLDEWSVDAQEATCVVDLFATPKDGELIFEDELNKTFDFYVALHCLAIPGTGINGETLNTFSVELFFENCD